jgi:hypothetical protein
MGSRGFDGLGGFDRRGRLDGRKGFHGPDRCHRHCGAKDSMGVVIGSVGASAGGASASTGGI